MKTHVSESLKLKLYTDTVSSNFIKLATTLDIKVKKLRVYPKLDVELSKRQSRDGALELDSF